MNDLGHLPIAQVPPTMSVIILAAGYSSRMGQFKPLLSIGPCTALETVIHLFVSARVRDVCVVLGHRASELRPLVKSAGAHCVLNPNFDRGMFSSIQAGVAALPPDTEAAFIMPADIPLVDLSTVNKLISQFAATKEDVIYPVFQNRRGHPTLISRTLFTEVLQAAPDSKLSTLLASHEVNSCNVSVHDEAIHLDMDTPGDLSAIRKLAAEKLRGSDVARLSRQ